MTDLISHFDEEQKPIEKSKNRSNGGKPENGTIIAWLEPVDGKKLVL